MARSRAKARLNFSAQGLLLASRVMVINGRPARNNLYLTTPKKAVSSKIRGQ